MPLILEGFYTRRILTLGIKKRQYFGGFKLEKLLVDDKILIWIIFMNFYEFLNRVKHLMHSAIRIVGSYVTIKYHCQMILEYWGYLYN